MNSYIKSSIFNDGLKRMAQMHLGHVPIHFASRKNGQHVRHMVQRIVPILLMSHECVLGLTCNKTIRVSSPIPSKSQMRLHHDGVAIYMVEFQEQRLNTSPEGNGSAHAWG